MYQAHTEGLHTVCFGCVVTKALVSTTTTQSLRCFVTTQAEKNLRMTQALCVMDTVKKQVKIWGICLKLL